MTTGYLRLLPERETLRGQVACHWWPSVLTVKEKSEWVRQLRFPVTYPRIYLELARERGLEPDAVLREAGMDAAVFADPSGRITPQEYMGLILTVMRLTGDHGLGLEIGLRLPMTAHGSLGYALMCCGTAAEAAEVLQRFWHLRGRGIRFYFSVQEEWLVFDFRTELDVPDALRRVLFDAMLTSFYRGLQFLLGETGELGELWFDYPEPEYFAQFRERLPVVRYGMAATQIRVRDTSLLQRKLPMSNPEALSLAIAQCEREYALLGEGQDDTLAATRTLLRLSVEGYPTPEQIADKLHMSPRTFRRRLQAQDSNYKLLLEDARRRDALVLLENPGLEIQKVAELLGYTTPANFTRAFRQWTGKAPSAYRALHQSLHERL